MSMSEEDKMVLYDVLQDLADELRKIPKAEREKHSKINTARRKFDEKGRIVLELRENMVTEHIYYDDSTTPRVAFPSYAKWQVYWKKGDEKTIAEGVCKIRGKDQQNSGLKRGINQVSSTGVKELWRQRGCSDTWNDQPFTF